MMNRTLLVGMEIKSRRASLAWSSHRSSAASRLIANFSKAQMLFPEAAIIHSRPREPSRQSPTLTASGLFRSSPEIQSAINTHRSRSGQRFCPIHF